MNEKHNIEPGLIQLFRLFTGIQFALLVLTLCATSAEEDPGTVVFSFLGALVTGFLLVWLSVPRLRRWFGRAFLPLALIVGGVGPLVAYWLSVLARLDSGLFTGDAAADDPGAMILWLFMPLVVTAVQYGQRSMLFYVFGTSLLDLLLSLTYIDLNGPSLELVFENVVARVLVFGIIGYIVARLMKAQRAQRAELKAANEQLALHAATLEQLAVSQERNRMARDLHDTLAHTLSAVSLQLEAATAVWDTNPDAARDTVRKSLLTTRNGLEETRRALKALRSSPIDDLGLSLAIRTLAESTAQRAGVALRVQTPNDPLEVAPQVEQNVYRIAEEALENVVRHANAKRLAVKLAQENGCLTLTIADDGVGYDPDDDAPSGHFGVVGMHERALLCSGSLTVDSAPGKGTKINLVVQVGEATETSENRGQSLP